MSGKMMQRTWKMVWFKRNRYALTIVAIALSVAFIVSTLLLTTSISNVGEPLNEAYDDVAAVVTGPELAELDGPGGAMVTVPVPASTVDALQDAGYEAVGFNQPYAQVIDAAGNPAGQDQAAANVAEPWLGDSALNAFTLVDGTAPAAQGEVVLDVSTSADAGYVVGDVITYVTDAGLQSAELVGIATFGGADNDPYVSTMLLDPGDPLFELNTDMAAGPVADGYDYVLVGAIDGVPAAETTAAVADLAPDMAVITGSEWVTSQVDTLNSFLGFFETFLTVFAIIAVVVGMVIVTNTFTVSLAQRTQELALQRLVGATKRQLTTQVVVEALMLGLAGTVIGIGLGLVGVDALGLFLDALGLSIERSDAISLGALATGAAVGIGVTVLAAVWPARKASAVAPVEALRSAEVEPPTASRKRAISAALATVVGAGALLYGAVQADIIIAGVGIGGLFLALYLGGEFLIRAVARVTEPLLGRGGPTGGVASRNLERNAGRTASAASALMIGVSLIAFFTLMAATIGQFIAGDSADDLTADYVVQSIGTVPEAVITDDTIAELSSVDGVQLVVPMETASTAVAGTTGSGPVEGADSFGRGPDADDGLTVGFTNIDDLTEVYQFTVVDGSLADVSDQQVLIDQASADFQGIAVGDTLTLEGQGGSVDVEVAAVVSESLPGFTAPQAIGAAELADARLASTTRRSRPMLWPTHRSPEAALDDAVTLPTLDVMTNERLHRQPQQQPRHDPRPGLRLAGRGRGDRLGRHRQHGDAGHLRAGRRDRRHASGRSQLKADLLVAGVGVRVAVVGRCWCRIGTGLGVSHRAVPGTVRWADQLSRNQRGHGFNHHRSRFDGWRSCRLVAREVGISCRHPRRAAGRVNLTLSNIWSKRSGTAQVRAVPLHFCRVGWPGGITSPREAETQAARDVRGHGRDRDLPRLHVGSDRAADPDPVAADPRSDGSLRRLPETRRHGAHRRRALHPHPRHLRASGGTSALRLLDPRRVERTAADHVATPGGTGGSLSRRRLDLCRAGGGAPTGTPTNHSRRSTDGVRPGRSLDFARRGNQSDAARLARLAGRWFDIQASQQQHRATASEP